MAALGSGQYGQAEKVVLRPLSIGMASEGSEVLLKPGATTKLIGFDVVEKGLRRLGGFRPIYDTPVPLLFGMTRRQKIGNWENYQKTSLV